jgi:hypothetical protein
MYPPAVPAPFRTSGFSGMTVVHFSAAGSLGSTATTRKFGAPAFV